MGGAGYEERRRALRAAVPDKEQRAPSSQAVEDALTAFADYLRAQAPRIPDCAARRLKGRRGMRWWRARAAAVVAPRLAHLNGEWDQRLARARAAWNHRHFDASPTLQGTRRRSRAGSVGRGGRRFALHRAGGRRSRSRSPSVADGQAARLTIWRPKCPSSTGRAARSRYTPHAAATLAATRRPSARYSRCGEGRGATPGGQQ